MGADASEPVGHRPIRDRGEREGDALAEGGGTAGDDETACWQKVLKVMKLLKRKILDIDDEIRQLKRTLKSATNEDFKKLLEANLEVLMENKETLAERESGSTEAKVVDQVKAGLAGRSAQQVASMVIAYEPIWAIGTGRTATAADAQAVCSAIRACVMGEFGLDAGESVRIQYGGSVKAGNIAELIAQPDVDGALVGGASLDPEEFARIVQYRLHEDAPGA